MKTENNEHGGRKILTILSDGKFHQSVTEGTEGSVVREYEDKDGVKKSKTELIFDSVLGTITGVSFRDAEGLGKFLEITLDDDGMISISTSSSFGEDIMKKLPNIDLEKEVKLIPYSFEDKGKVRKGVTIIQEGIKIENYYWNSETKVSSNGIPETEGDTATFDSEDWKIHFIKVRKFLVSEIEKNIITQFKF